ncbi:MAG TPA: Glu/Leu/Phe/Val dehydrogenase [Pseudogracilibacillus sp.]|nr:Glu/Leu/Phe/Val dehydrogenase [Pseudogracilibacillus sp.]
MEIFNILENDDYEQVVFCQDKASGLKAVIAIHDTTLGPALGGTRIWNYNTEAEAIEDALRLAKGMTYKNAAAGLNLGGGKAVIIGDAGKVKSEALFRAFGRYIESLNGRYITAEDVGTTVQDMDYIHMETDSVLGHSRGTGVGDPSPVTALGIYKGIKSAAKAAFDTDDLKDKTIAVQGVGHVAFQLCRHLHEEGAKLVVTDINQTAVQKAVEEFNATAVEPNAIYSVDCDIFAPCALGGVINDETINTIKAKVIAGSANNQLQTDKHGEKLHEKGIVYAPDFVINSGGVINVAEELAAQYDQESVMMKVSAIYDALDRVFAISKTENIPTSEAANRMAEERIEAMKQSRGQYLK